MDGFCEHPNTEVRVRIITGGAKVLMRQCLDCGYSVGSFISQKDKSPEYLATRKMWDEDKPKATRISNRALADAGIEQRAIERQTKSVEWWKWYNEYLRSPKWLYKRERALERDKYQCQGCLEAPAEQVHHLTYDHVGDELLFELTSVCKACHDRTHLRVGRDGPPTT